MKHSGLFLTLVTTLATPVVACDLCSVYSANQARGEIGKGFVAAVAEQFTHFGTMQEDGREVPNEVGQYLDSSVSQLLVGYNFNERIGVQFNVPVVYRSFKRPEGFDIDRGTVSGVGDVSLTGHLQAFRSESKNLTFGWNLLAGVKFPTGDSSRIAEELNEVEVESAPESGIHGHDLTLGSGSFDGIVGTSVFLRSHRVFLTASAQYSIRSQGDFGYRFADDLTWVGGPGYFVALNDRCTLSLQAVVSGEHKARDTFQGAPAEDTGVTTVYCGPQIIFTWSDKLSAEVCVDVPVSIDNTALQTVADYRVRAGVTWHF